MPRSVKIAPEIDAKLYEELVSVAKENGQSQRFVLERALEHYLHNVVPSQRAEVCRSPRASFSIQVSGKIAPESRAYLSG